MIGEGVGDEVVYRIQVARERSEDTKKTSYWCLHVFDWRLCRFQLRK